MIASQSHFGYVEPNKLKWGQWYMPFFIQTANDALNVIFTFILKEFVSLVLKITEHTLDRCSHETIKAMFNSKKNILSQDKWEYILALLLTAKVLNRLIFSHQCCYWWAVGRWHRPRSAATGYTLCPWWQLAMTVLPSPQLSQTVWSTHTGLKPSVFHLGKARLSINASARALGDRERGHTHINTQLIQRRRRGWLGWYDDNI